MRTIAAVTNGAGPVNQVRDILNPRTCLTFFYHEKVSNVVRDMHGHHSGAAGVVDGAGRFIGLVTEREILRRLFQMKPESKEQQRFADEAKAVMDLTAWDVMIASPDCLVADLAVEDALDEITCKGYRYMPVMDNKDPDKKLVGIVSERELFMHVQEKNRRKMQAKDSLLSYFMHHESYGGGAVVM